MLSKYLNLKNFAFSTIAFGFISCGGGSDKKAEEFTVVKNTQVSATIDKAMAEKGKLIFQTKCSACHKYDVRFVGPSIGKVTERRTADYILSQILYPEQMIAKNDTVKALLGVYMTQMTNQHLTPDDARTVLEHLRDVAAGGGK